MCMNLEVWKAFCRIDKITSQKIYNAAPSLVALPLVVLRVVDVTVGPMLERADHDVTLIIQELDADVSVLTNVPSILKQQ